jgi:hypothetical protein
MAWFGRSIRRFTAAESFHLFMEGVRSLQHYDKKATADPPVEEDVLNSLLGDAEKFFEQCMNAYPKDILPRYYLGIVLSIQAQVEQARAVRDNLSATIPVTNAKADKLFLRAAYIFGHVAEDVGHRRGGRDILAYSQYNQAQALAKVSH